MTPLVAWLGACTPPRALDTARPELQDCHLPDLSTQARCGHVTVPEDPRNDTGRALDIHFAVVEARARAPRPDPIFFLAGGPGQAATEAFPPLLSTMSDVLWDRDAVLVDIRGTGGSNALRCDFAETPGQLLRARFDPEELRACLAALEAAPEHYTTAHAVDDLERVRAALGYERIDLIGGSYGTRLGLEYMRRFPERIRSAVLDGVVPPQMAMPDGFAVDAQASFDLLVRDCAAQPACAAAFPDPARDLHQMLADLTEGDRELDVTHPRTGRQDTVTVDRTIVAASVRGILYSTELSATLPWTLRAAAEGDLRPLLGQSLVLGESFGQSMSVGLLLSMMCSEDVPRIEPDAARARDAATFLGPTLVEIYREGCEVWPHGPLPEWTGRPVESSVPALLLSGEADPATPPHWADLAMGTLSRATHVVVPHAGHGTLTRGCIPELVAGFLDAADPGVIDPTCATSVDRPAFFIDALGPAVR